MVLIRVPDARSRFGLTDYGVRQLVRSGRIGHRNIPGCSLEVNALDLARVVAEATVPASA